MANINLRATIKSLKFTLYAKVATALGTMGYIGYRISGGGLIVGDTEQYTVDNITANN